MPSPFLLFSSHNFNIVDIFNFGGKAWVSIPKKYHGTEIELFDKLCI
jgi:hypothetical protein